MRYPFCKKTLVRHRQAKTVKFSCQTLQRSVLHPVLLEKPGPYFVVQMPIFIGDNRDCAILMQQWNQMSQFGVRPAEERRPAEDEDRDFSTAHAVNKFSEIV